MKEVKELIKEAISKIPVPPQGREMALVKTKLEEALLWCEAKNVLNN
ncbi:MAG: hypothetical protein ACM3O3_12605 [Syntrophothermus sp.]